LPKKISVCFKRPIIRPANPRGLHNPSLGRWYRILSLRFRRNGLPMAAPH
jgi:hypothetical protein